MGKNFSPRESFQDFICPAVVTMKVGICNNINLFWFDTVFLQIMHQCGEKLRRPGVYKNAQVTLNYIGIAVEHSFFRIKV